MIPNLLLAWPDAYRYPIFEKFLRDHWIRFTQTIIVITRTNYQYQDAPLALKLLEQEVPRIKVVNAPQRLPDWRDDAMMYALEFTTSDWLLFMEQDFIIKNLDILEKIKELTDTVLGQFKSTFSFYGFKQGERIHPGFLLVQRGVLLGLVAQGAHFAPVPGVSDHFDMLTALLNSHIQFTSLEELGFNTPEDYYHYNGLTHNKYLHSIGQEVTYHPDEFYAYLEKEKEFE